MTDLLHRLAHGHWPRWRRTAYPLTEEFEWTRVMWSVRWCLECDLEAIRQARVRRGRAARSDEVYEIWHYPEGTVAEIAPARRGSRRPT